jgi:hypothetical protein
MTTAQQATIKYNSTTNYYVLSPKCFNRRTVLVSGIIPVTLNGSLFNVIYRVAQMFLDTSGSKLDIE